MDTTFQIETSLTQQLKNLLLQATNEGKSIACWSLPKQQTIHVIISDITRELSADFELENLEEGFIIAPFDNNKHSIYFLQKDIYWNSEEPFNNALIKSDPAEANKLHVFGPGKPVETPQEHYISMVKKAVEGIENGKYEKVVPARTKTTSLPDEFDNLEFFFNLNHQYPDAFVSFYNIPGKGTWFGATPETLIEVDEDIFRTVALAGTHPYESSQSIKETSWTQKEIEEQALVSRYIINCFKKIRLREFSEFGPKTIRAGNLLHLKTEYQVDLQSGNYSNLGTTMLKLLHPTSAICGMPLEATQQFIKDNEDFDRSYFSGYLGPVNINSSTNIFVNLRCLQIIEDQAIAYAGAGVTIDSDPAKEYNETEIKMNTLIRLLK